MPRLIILGSAHAVPNLEHENSHLIVCGSERTVLVDAPGNPLVRLQRAAIDPFQVTDLVVTHFHPDHVSGVPLLLLDLWLLGRQEPLNIYGLADTVDRLKQMLELYTWQRWPGFFQVNFVYLESQEATPVLDCPEFDITASPTRHMIPSIALRFNFHEIHQAVVYSSDTGPSLEVARLATGADILIHEATGAGLGHSSAAQAGEIARQAEVKCLYLIHYDPNEDLECLVTEASAIFQGPVVLAKDLLAIELPYQPIM